jgi:cytochrome b561
MPSRTYGPTQKTLHWLVFLLVVFLYGITYAEELYPRGDPGRAMVWWLHIAFGLLLIAVVVLRVGVRAVEGTPAQSYKVSWLKGRLATLTHGILYVLLFAVPIIGMVLTWYRGDALSFFGLFTIPAPFPPEKETARSVRELHELGANALLIVAGLHALAALYHYFIRRDDVLQRMLPGYRAPEEDDRSGPRVVSAE